MASSVEFPFEEHERDARLALPLFATPAFASYSPLNYVPFYDEAEE